MSLLPSCDRMVFSEDILKWVQSSKHKVLSRQKAESLFPLPIKLYHGFWCLGSKQRFGNIVLSSRTEQGDNARNWKERKDKVKLFFSFVCHKRKILLCLTVHIKALILRIFETFVHHGVRKRRNNGFLSLPDNHICLMSIKREIGS